jgi:hypothetical protein
MTRFTLYQIDTVWILTTFVETCVGRRFDL